MNSLKTTGLFFIFIFFAGLKVSAAACSDMQLRPVGTAYHFSSSLIVNPSVLVTAITKDGGCDFFLTVGYGVAMSYLTRRLVNGVVEWPVIISKDAAGSHYLKKIDLASSSNDIVTGTLPPANYSASVWVNFWAQLFSASGRAAGNYSDSFVVTLYKGTLANHTLVGSYTLSLYMNVAKEVDISIVPTGSTFNIADTTEDINFGVLEQGATRTADVILKYNAGYRLTASSANNSRLKHATQNTFVPYTINFAGSAVNLTSSANAPVQIRQGSGVSPGSGLIFHTAVTIGTLPANQTNGSYTDTITLTVQSP